MVENENLKQVQKLFELTSICNTDKQVYDIICIKKSRKYAHIYA